MARTVYDVIVVSTTGGQPTSSVEATIDGDKITGPGADWVRETIRSHHEIHPKTSPDIIFCGGYCWAQKRVVPSGPA